MYNPHKDSSTTSSDTSTSSSINSTINESKDIETVEYLNSQVNSQDTTQNQQNQRKKKKTSDTMYSVCGCLFFTIIIANMVLWGLSYTSLFPHKHPEQGLQPVAPQRPPKFERVFSENKDTLGNNFEENFEEAFDKYADDFQVNAEKNVSKIERVERVGIINKAEAVHEAKTCPTSKSIPDLTEKNFKLSGN